MMYILIKHGNTYFWIFYYRFTSSHEYHVSYYLALSQTHIHKGSITELLEFNIHCNFQDDELPERERERDKKFKVF